MKRGIFLLLAFILCFIQQAYSMEVILPREKKSCVTTEYAFFVGKAKGAENITINNEHVYTASNGAFAHSVKLKEGTNRIAVRSNYGVLIYTIFKTTPKVCTVSTEEFEMKKATVLSDNTPLRNTPIDGGLNRIGHLFKDTDILINGANDDFYRVYLAENEFAWIAKKDVKILDTEYLEPAEFLDMKSERFKNATVQTIEFTKKLPYSVEDGDDEIIFKIYNSEQMEDSIYTLNIPKPPKYVYNITLEGGKYTFKVRSIPKDIKDCTIVIDAGHGGLERGAVGCLGDEEKNINLQIAVELEKLLRKTGANIIMTREYDCNVALKDRVQIAKDNNADIFVSIHLNSIGDIPMDIHKNRGTSVYYFNDESEELANYLLDSVTSTLKTRNDGVRTASFAVIRPSDYLGVLVETAYMTNPLDSVLYTSPDFCEKAAKGIAKGIEEFVKLKQKRLRK